MNKDLSFRVETDLKGLDPLTQQALVELRTVCGDVYSKASTYIINAREKAVRDALIALGWTPPAETQWQPIETAPREGMFIYAKAGRNGKWAVGIAYNTVSDTQVDHVSAQPVSRLTDCLLWHPMPTTPRPRDLTKKPQ
jgi:hypothetical protein